MLELLGAINSRLDALEGEVHEIKALLESSPRPKDPPPPDKQKEIEQKVEAIDQTYKILGRLFK